MYMSYCRYEGTEMELRACVSNVEEHVNEEAEYEVSNSEIQHFRNIVYFMVDFLTEQEIINEDGNVDEAKLDEVCEKMRNAYPQEGEW